MPDPKLEDVYKLSGIPTHTFVRPVEYEQLLVNLRTPGRGVVIEGPSGIGKTTAVSRALDELGMQAQILTARRAEDSELVDLLPEISAPGVVIIDDFHRLTLDTRRKIADYLKTLADEERTDVKIVVVGINRAGEALVSIARDLNNRIETIRFEANPPERVEQLVSLGEKSLNIKLDVKQEIVEASNGSFYIAQMLSHNTCLLNSVLDAQEQQHTIETSFELVRSRVMEKLSGSFLEIAKRFARGNKLRPEGRAPYLHILKWLADANEWSIFLDQELTTHPNLKGSVGQVVDKGFLAQLIEESGDIGDVLHYEKETRVLAVEDPQFVFFIRNLPWNDFTRQVGYTRTYFESPYDFALSFAGHDRPYAEVLFDELSDQEFAVFYDKNEQHRILAENVEDYLGPIYRSEARYVVILLGPEYPKRIWTKFESEQFRDRLGDGSVIPIWFTTAPPGMFDESTRVGGIQFDPTGDVDKQLRDIAELLRRKIRDDVHQLQFG